MGKDAEFAQIWFDYEDDIKNQLNILYLKQVEANLITAKNRKFAKHMMNLLPNLWASCRAEHKRKENARVNPNKIL